MPSPFLPERLKAQRQRRPPRRRRRPRRSLHSPHNALTDKLADLATLDPDDQAALLKVLDALVMKHKLQALTGGAG